MAHVDAAKSESEKRRLKALLEKEPEAFKTKLRGDIDRLVEKWRTEFKVEIPHRWRAEKEKSGKGKKAAAA